MSATLSGERRWTCSLTRANMSFACRGGSIPKRRNHMALLSKTVITSVFAAAMLAGSSFAFAADDGNSNNNDSVGKSDQTGSITNQGDSPSMDERVDCMNAAADDPACMGKTQQ